MGNYRNFKLVVYFVAQGTANTTREKLQKQLDFFKKYMRLDKVYLEPFRTSTFASAEQVAMCREVFEQNGVEVAGGITTTMLTPDGDEPKQRMFDTVCYNDEKMIDLLKRATTFLGKTYNEFIIDDFFFTNCTCDKCRAGRDEYNAAHGITDGSWQAYRTDLMRRVSEDYIIAPAKAQNPDVKITIKFPNWAEGYQETGYNPKEQREIFEFVYTGTETRDPLHTDQHIPRYLSFSLMTYFEAMCPGRNGGGWFDPFDLHSLDQYLEQAYLTAFAKPKEMMMFCFQALADSAEVAALGYHLDKLDDVLDHLGSPIGVPCYLPDNAQGEDNLQDFLGMNGVPIVCTPYFPENAPALLLTESAAYDESIVEKLENYVVNGGTAMITTGFAKATMNRGLKRMTSIRFSDRVCTAKDYMVERMDQHYIRRFDFAHGTAPVSFRVPEFRNNSTWALVKAIDGEENFGVLLQDTYGKGKLLTIAALEAFSQYRRLPAEALSRIRAELPVGGVWMEGKEGMSLFVYDNDTLLLYPYVQDGMEDADVRIHVKGDAKALRALQHDGFEIKPCYRTETETVFQVPTKPGKYESMQIVR